MGCVTSSSATIVIHPQQWPVRPTRWMMLVPTGSQSRAQSGGVPAPPPSPAGKAELPPPRGAAAIALPDPSDCLPQTGFHKDGPDAPSPCCGTFPADLASNHPHFDDMLPPPTTPINCCTIFSVALLTRASGVQPTGLQSRVSPLLPMGCIVGPITAVPR